MKMTLRVLGVILLLALFAAVYSVVTNLGGDDYGVERTSVGTLGGYHFFKDLAWEDRGDFFRIAIETELNRDSIIKSAIDTPYVEVIPETAADPVLFGDGERLMPELGDYRLVVNLSDTRRFDISGETAELVYIGQEEYIVNDSPLTSILVHQPPDDSLQQVLIGLDTAMPFRLSTDPQDAGIVWIDILK